MNEDELNGAGTLVFVDKDGYEIPIGNVDLIETCVRGAVAVARGINRLFRATLRFNENHKEVRKKLRRLVNRGKCKGGHGKRKRAVREAEKCLHRK